MTGFVVRGHIYPTLFITSPPTSLISSKFFLSCPVIHCLSVSPQCGSADAHISCYSCWILGQEFPGDKIIEKEGGRRGEGRANGRKERCLSSAA